MSVVSMPVAMMSAVVRLAREDEASDHQEVQRYEQRLACLPESYLFVYKQAYNAAIQTRMKREAAHGDYHRRV